MYKYNLHMNKKYVLVFLCSFGFAVSCFGQSKNSQTNYEFHYEDIRNFKKVYEVAKSKGDTLKAMEDYFANASEGMKAWLDRYNRTPKLMTTLLNYMPNYYAYLSNIEDELVKYEGAISKGLDGLKKIYPSKYVHIPPIYYFILFGGGGSAEMTANMISVDYFANYDELDTSEFKKVGGVFPEGKWALVSLEMIPQIAVHEVVHLFQSYMQGEEDYVSIYLDKGKTSMQAYAIREGGADFLAFLGSGYKIDERHIYGDANEEELWRQFKEILDANPDDNPGWFSGKSKINPDWPWQIGYYMGFKIVEYYYNQSDDKKMAIKLILNSHENEDFEKFIKSYSKKWK